jgi:hypothetical protein
MDVGTGPSRLGVGANLVNIEAVGITTIWNIKKNFCQQSYNK